MKRLAPAIIAVFIALTLAACGSGGRVWDASDLQGRTVGVLGDSASESCVAQYGGSVTLRTFSDTRTMSAALKSGDIDCAVCDKAAQRSMTGIFSGLRTLDGTFVDDDYTLAVSVDNRQMLEKLNSALLSIRENGTLGRIVDGWLEDGAFELGGEDGRDLTDVTVAVEPGFYPYAFYSEDGELTGLEIDVVRAVCRQLGLRPVFLEVEPDMLIYVAESGKCSFAAGRIAPDPNNGALSYTDAYMHDTQYIVVKK